MVSILDFLETYRPAGLSPYIPDRIFLRVLNGRSEFIEDLPEIGTAWPEHLPSLSIETEKLMYFEGQQAQEVYALFGMPPSVVLFVENGIEYTVWVEIIEPHEEIRIPTLPYYPP
jgi:hypothetical protein